MKCAICLMAKEGVAFDAITVMGGTAVCEHHMTLVADDNVRFVLRGLPVLGGSVQYQTDEDFKDSE